MQFKVSAVFSSVLLLCTFSPLAYANDATGPTSTVLSFGTTPIPLFAIPTDLALPKSEDAATIEAIRNTMALYPFTIDGKNFAALNRVFKEDAIANYSAPLNVLTPLSQIISTLNASLTCVTTQHLLGTQLIEVIQPTVAQSITYYRAAHFGLGALADQVVYAYGQYQDTWQKQGDGTWKIMFRNLVYMGPIIGDLAIFDC